MWADGRRGGGNGESAWGAPARASVGGAERLALGSDDRLPWLDSPDDYDDAGGFDGGRLARFVFTGLAILALVIGGIWWLVRASGPGAPDGSLIRAEAGPYKVRPEAPGGKTFAGTGDSSYAVSEGESRGAALSQADVVAAPGEPGGTAAEPNAPLLSGVGVQVGAYMDREAAEAGWQTLAQRNPLLSGVGHRVVEGRADIGTVYRLQAVAGSAAAAEELCRGLRAAGQDCQVKR